MSLKAITAVHAMQTWSLAFYSNSGLKKRCDIPSVSGLNLLTLSQVYCFTGDSASTNHKMMEHLDSQFRYVNTNYNWIKLREGYVPCLAHIIHLSVMAFLNAINAKPPDRIELYASEDQTTDSPAHKRACGNNGIAHNRYRGLTQLHGFALTIAKLQEIAKATCNSPQQHEEFQVLVEQELGKRLKLKLDVQTRWHSTALMFQRALILRQPITQWLGKHSELDALSLKSSDWDHMVVILQALTPFYQCAMGLMEAKGITIHLTFQAYGTLFSHIERMSKAIMTPRRQNGRRMRFAVQINQGLDFAAAKLSKYYSQTDPNLTYYAAHFLHPSKKGGLFKTAAWSSEAGAEPYYNQYKNAVEQRYRDHYCDQVSVSAPNCHSRSQASDDFNPEPVAEIRHERAIFDSDDEEGDPDEETMDRRKDFEQYLSQCRLPKPKGGSTDQTKSILGYWKS